jgi:transcriptional regulator with XRE-family HTH domain
MNYSVLKIEILKALRGSQSQSELSRRLGYSYNQVGKWEANAKRMKWTDFHNFCEVCGVSMTSVTRKVFLFTGENSRDTAALLSTLQVFNSLLSHQELAQKLNCHVSLKVCY